MTSRPTVLLIDDDLSHLKLYSWILDRGGYRALPLLAANATVDLPRSEPIAVSVLDYQLGVRAASVRIARQLVEVYPSKPVLVLSDMHWLPDDIAPYASGYVRKGEPEELLQTISKLIGKAGTA